MKYSVSTSEYSDHKWAENTTEVEAEGARVGESALTFYDEDGNLIAGFSSWDRFTTSG